jgi:hypothetical protein
MAYDKAKYHHDSDQFPKDLPWECGGTHIGMFLAWAVHRRLISDELAEEAPADVGAVRDRRMTGRQLLYAQLDGTLCEDDLSDDGNDFAASYYESNTYGREYGKLFAGRYPTDYHVEDSWVNFDLVAEVIDKQYAAWTAKRP